MNSMTRKRNGLLTQLVTELDRQEQEFWDERANRLPPFTGVPIDRTNEKKQTRANIIALCDAIQETIENPVHTQEPLPLKTT